MSSSKSSSKILDLDAFAGGGNQLKFKGKTYDITDPELSTFLEVLALQEQIPNLKDTKQVIPVLVELLAKVVPDMPQEVIQKMSLAQIRKALDFIISNLGDGVSSKNTTTPAEEVASA